MRPMPSEDVTRRAALPVVRGGKLYAPGGVEVAIDLAPVVVGRDPSSELRLDDPEVSAAHCELCATARGVTLRDLGSTNGTHVGSAAVVEVLLTGPCMVRVGKSELRFQPSLDPITEHLGDAVDHFGPLLGASLPMRRLYRLLAAVARTDLSILLTGETGTGKELAARAIHEASPRCAHPFVVLDCGALPGALAESILFGHERGSFTGATARADGAFHAAQGGTVFLDEIGELPLELQPRLLRAIAERTVKRVGGSHYDPIDVRVVAATRRDLRRDVNAQRFRDDLYFRLAQVRAELPPLRERMDDLPLLVEAACRRLDREEAAPRVAGYVQGRFRNYDWPGNVRELVNVASVLAALGDEGAEQVLPFEAAKATGDVRAEGFVEAKRRFEEAYFRRLLDATQGNISEVSRRCGLARHQVRSHLRKLGLID
jgi:DNA-binding NtrC family response regulator